MTDHTQNPPDGETEESAGARSRYVRTLLIAVITLGVILVGGITVVVGTIIKRVSDPESNVPVRPGFGKTQIKLPAGSEIDDIIAADGRIVVRVRDAGGTMLLLLDPRRGEERGRIRLNELD
ncbi:MAG: DUF6476 family protein [Pseudomonadota bacterium]|nr:DUF6476 family protein [Pseudomonadota bacterium]